MTDNVKEQALLDAIDAGDRQKFDAALKEKPDINFGGGEPLIHAAIKNNFSFAHDLMDAGASLETAMATAAAQKKNSLATNPRGGEYLRDPKLYERSFRADDWFDYNKGELKKAFMGPRLKRERDETAELLAQVAGLRKTLEKLATPATLEKK